MAANIMLLTIIVITFVGYAYFEYRDRHQQGHIEQV